jgi:hypothetical protein
MYAPLSPILAAESADKVDTLEVLAQIEGLAVVLAAVSRLAGQKNPAPFDALAHRAELSAVLASAAPEAVIVAARHLDTLGGQLHAGLLALERARAAARLNRAAAALLHAESAADYHAVLTRLGYSAAQ